MKIGELARRAGVSVRSLRYYEKQGLLSSTRTTGGHRLFAEGDVDRVTLVQLLFAAGVPSATVVDILPCVRSGTTTAAMVDRLSAEHDRLRERTRTMIATLEALDDVLTEARSRLTAKSSSPVHR